MAVSGWTCKRPSSVRHGAARGCQPAGENRNSCCRIPKRLLQVRRRISSCDEAVAHQCPELEGCCCLTFLRRLLSALIVSEGSSSQQGGAAVLAPGGEESVAPQASVIWVSSKCEEKRAANYHRGTCLTASSTFRSPAAGFLAAAKAPDSGHLRFF